MPALGSPETLIIFTTSPTGLGHIRVANALAEGLQPGVNHITIGLSDVNAGKIHALGSRIPFFQGLTEYVQNNRLPESIVTGLYAKYFSAHTTALINELEKARREHPEKKTYVIVSTHFSLAYPVAAIKESFQKRTGIRIINVLIVTDDSPQQIWAVDRADIIFVPSHSTAKTIKEYLPFYSKTVVETISFPVSPRLASRLSDDELLLRENQLDPKKGEDLHISVPVSGAAVQLGYLENVIKSLAQKEFVFTVIGQMTNYTASFFEAMKGVPHVQLSAGSTASETVKLYSSAFYQGLRPSVEITKPSEQAFKAILKPSERGGVILLLTAPIGRQERDNLDFLSRHSLLPEIEEQRILDDYLIHDIVSQEVKNNIFYKASHWRALKLPENPEKAAHYIKRAKDEGLLYTMLSYIPEVKTDLRSDGVAQVWTRISKML